MNKPCSRKSQPIVICLSLGAGVMLAVWAASALRPQPAQAIPMFADRTGASCEVCHTVFPGMTNYGMMVMMSNFSMLPYEAAENPGLTSLIWEEQYDSNPDAGVPKLHTQNLGFLSGGFLGPHVTYYLEQHWIDSGFIGGTDQLWVAYNNLFGGTGALQLGKFHTPFPFMPAHRITLAPYATTSSTLGENGFNEDDSHWGVTLSRMQGALMYSFSALGGNDEIGPGALQLAGNHDHSLDFSLMTMSDNPLNFGVGLIHGFAPVDDGFDRFDRAAAYFQFIPRGDARLNVQGLVQLGYDRDPFGTGQRAHTRGAFLEAQYRLSPGNFGILRWDTQNGDSPIAGLTFDFIHLVAPNAKITLEARSLTTGTSFGAGFAWAGPWTRSHVLATPKLGSMPGMNMGMSMGGMSMGGMQGMPGMASMPGMQMAAATLPELAHALSHGDAAHGATAYTLHSCANCHGAGGRGGGIGPRLVGIAAAQTPEQIYDFIKHPRAPMPDFKLTDAEIADLVAYVVSLTPGHSAQQDIVKEYHLTALPEEHAMMMPIGMPPPTYAPDQPPLESGSRGLFRGIELGEPGTGARLFGASCASCHGAGAAGASATKLLGLADTQTPSAIAWSIKNHAPALSNMRLSNREIADIVAFLESLGAPRARPGAPLSHR